MTDNELIARWVGVVEPDDYNANPRDCLMMHGTEVVRFYVGLNPGTERWSPDTNTTLWHGNDGLLAEIKNRGLIEEFINELDVDIFGTDDSFYSDLFSAITATPAQLTAALITVINKE